MVRATVLTYRWIDELQEAAYKTLGRIAGRAIGYLAPEIALGGAIVSAGLIETDALDRDDVAAYLNELAELNPELMDHVTSGGGGLLDGLQMRSLLTVGVLARDDGHAGRARRPAGLRGAAPAGRLRLRAARRRGRVRRARARAARGRRRAVDGPAQHRGADGAARPRRPRACTCSRVGEQRYIAYLPGPNGGTSRRLRLVGGDHSTYAAQVVRAIEHAVSGDPGARVMLVGSAQGGVTAAEVAAATAAVVVRDRPGRHRRRPVRPGAADPRHHPGPLARGPRRPGGAARLADQRRRGNRVTVVFDSAAAEGLSVYVAGGRAADSAEHPELRGRDRAPAGGRLPRPLDSPTGRGQQMSCTNSPSWVRLRHSTIGTTSPYAVAAESPVSQCRGCSGLSHHACRAVPAISFRAPTDRSL